MRVEIVDIDPLHIREICDSLRARERRAFARATDPEMQVTIAVRESMMSFAGVVDGEVVALGGVQCRDIFADEAYIWILCGEGVERYPLAFIRGTLQAFELVKARFKTVYGFVDPSFVKSVRWLEWMGFSIGPIENGVREFRWTRP